MTAADTRGRSDLGLQKMAMLLAVGWLTTNLALSITEDLPLKFLLKNSVHLGPAALAWFLAFGRFSNYIKPVAGVLTDGIPLFKTRRFGYIMLSLGGGALFWLLLGVVPPTYYWLLPTYTLFYITVVLFSTTLGGKMVEVAQHHGAAGRLTAQRIGTFRLAAVVGSLVGGSLANHFGLAVAISAALHVGLMVLFWRPMSEPRTAVRDHNVGQVAIQQVKALLSSRTLLMAAGLVFLLAIAPGFGTPLFFYQTDHLKFSGGFLGVLGVISSATGLVGAWLYYSFCRKYSLRFLLGASIIAHALGTLFYLGYHTANAAIAITALSGITVTMTQLPIYDLAIRATPRGSEAMGYSVMMSAWNLTNALSDVIGSRLYEKLHIGFFQLVWLNAGTTAIMIFVVPILPAALLAARDIVSPKTQAPADPHDGVNSAVVAVVPDPVEV